ncbi:MAG: type II secretion system F family protein [Candidatus Aenigmatarchaeota archaeon]
MIKQSAVFFIEAYPGIVNFIKNFFEDLPRELKVLKYKDSPEVYIAQGILLSFLTFSFSLVFLTIIISVLSKNVVLSVSLSFLASSLISFSMFIFYLRFPSMRIKSLAIGIDRELHESLYTFSIFVNDKTPLQISINNFVKSNPQYKLSKELNDILKLMDFGGLDILSAIDKKIEMSASSKLSKFLFGLSTTIKGGGSIKSYVSNFATEEIEEYRNKIREAGRKMGMIMQIYLIVLVLGGMFINIIISIFSLLQPMEGVVEIQFFMGFVLIPLISIMIAQIIKTTLA